MAVRLRSFSRGASLVALGVALAGGCREEHECGSLAALCADEGRWVDLATLVFAAAAVDVDGDGETEMFALTHSGQQVAFGTRDGWRSMVFVEAGPLAIAALQGDEVAVSFAGAPLVAIFGLDGEGRIERRRDIPLSSASGPLVSGDLDGDGRPELVVALHEVGKVAVIDGSTGAVREYRAGKAPFSLALGDVDGDARLDVVALDHAAAALQVLRGAGDGELMPARASAADAEMQALALADHDGDGDLDAVTRSADDSVQIHRNNGEGEFSSPTGLPFLHGSASGVGLVAGPSAGGGLAGVSVPQDEGLSTWFGKGAAWLGRVEEPLYKAVTWVGAGTDSGLLLGGDGFVLPFTYARGVTPIEAWRDPSVRSHEGASALATGDLDGDHLLDVVAATHGQLLVLRGRADLGLQPEVAFGLDGTPLSLVVADLTGDELPDVLVAGEQSVRVAVGTDVGPELLNPADVTTVMPRRLTPLRTGPGSPDVVVAAAAGEGEWMPELFPAALLRFAADGRLVEERVLGEGLGVWQVIAVDFDEDGVDEPLILAGREGTPVLVHATPDGEGYVLGLEHDLSALSGVAAEAIPLGRMAAGDLDGDGAPEVMVTSTEGTIVVAGLAAGTPAATVLPEVSGPSHLRDIDGDERLDAVIAVRGAPFLYHRGLGDGRFDPASPRFDIPYGAEIALARPGAQFDVAIFASTGIHLHLAREVVRPTRAAEEFDFHGTVSELAVADVNQDGYDDLVTVSRWSSGGVSVLWGSENAALARADGFNGGLENRGLAVGDLDDDGFPEVVVSNGISWLEPFRFFPERVDEWLYLDPLDSLDKIEDLAIEDVDGDGLPDFLAMAYDEYSAQQMMGVYVAYGTEPLHFTEWSKVAAVPELETGALEIGEVDGDGDLDLLIRPVNRRSGLLVRAAGPRTWAEAEPMPGTTALFGPRDADGRVELITHEDTTVYRHVDGDPDRRVALVKHQTLIEGALRQVGDADDDGRYDLVVHDEEATYVWLRGDDGAVRVKVADTRLAAVQFPDLDGDGRRDLVGLGDGKLFVRHTRR